MEYSWGHQFTSNPPLALSQRSFSSYWFFLGSIYYRNKLWRFPSKYRLKESPGAHSPGTDKKNLDSKIAHITVHGHCACVYAHLPDLLPIPTHCYIRYHADTQCSLMWSRVEPLVKDRGFQTCLGTKGPVRYGLEKSLNKTPKAQQWRYTQAINFIK